MEHYDPTREISPEFVARVCDWIVATGEVFVVLRYLRACGQKDYLFCRSAAEFRDLVETLPIGTDTIVFQHSQLPLRGICSQAFIEQSLAHIPDGTEYLVTLLERPARLATQITGSMGDTHASLIEDMMDFLGERVAVGRCPHFIAPDNDFMISASKGGIDGAR